MKAKSHILNNASTLIVCVLCAVLMSVGVSLEAEALPELDYKTGDLIFHKSQSNQAKAILEATGSPWSHVGVLVDDNGEWFVLEAVQPVRIVSLKSFINRGIKKHYRTYRLPSLTDIQREALRGELTRYLGQNYDLFFEWSDDLTYCSELVYKAYVAVTSIEIGDLQKYSELRLNGPFVQELIRRRLTMTGRNLNLNEPIVTPVSQMNDPDLKLIIKTDP